MRIRRFSLHIVVLVGYTVDMESMWIGVFGTDVVLGDILNLYRQLKLSVVSSMTALGQ